jgi:hypothetical protein
LIQKYCTKHGGEIIYFKVFVPTPPDNFQFLGELYFWILFSTSEKFSLEKKIIMVLVRAVTVIYIAKCFHVSDSVRNILLLPTSLEEIIIWFYRCRNWRGNHMGDYEHPGFPSTFSLLRFSTSSFLTFHFVSLFMFLLLHIIVQCGVFVVIFLNMNSLLWSPTPILLLTPRPLSPSSLIFLAVF